MNSNLEKLTEKELEVYNYILDSIRRDGYSPSVRDICTALDIKSTSTVHTYLARLEQKGVIQKAPGKSRSLRVGSDVLHNTHTVRVPILGKVAAGIPILAVENYEGYIDFPRPSSHHSAGDLFALKIQGESMIDAGILDGDLIVVEKTCTANDGDIIVALVEDEATVKTFYHEGNRFRLQPENASMQPIYTDELLVLGKVVASMRFYR
ncbi:MAG: transcriptional repressor LexA [Ruminococcaceae bacterium]|nr:transcriptional repressor LexA [Oscillospiraceae bacterium]